MTAVKSIGQQLVKAPHHVIFTFCRTVDSRLQFPQLLIVDVRKELLKEFEGEGSHEKHSPEAHGFFDKVKDLWEDLKE